MRQLIDSSVEPVLWFAADWSLRWAAMIAVVGLLLWIFHPRRAALRQMFLLAVLMAGLLVPFVPRWGGGWTRHQQSELTPPPSTPSPSFPRSAWERTPGRSAARPALRQDAERPDVRSHAERGNEGASAEHHLPEPSEPLGLRRLIVLAFVFCWSFAVLFQLFRRLCGWLYLRRLARESVEATGATADLFAAVRAELGVRGTVRLASHPRVRSPILFGWLRLRIIVPPDWPQRSGAAQRAGLLHELAHVRRRDHLLVPLLGIVRIAFFFHPLVRWLLARLEYEREVLCDEVVVRLGIDRRDYARLLVEFARSCGRLGWSAVSLPMSRRRTVKGRIHHLLEEDMERWIRPLPIRWAVVSGTGLLALLLSLASYRVWAADKANADTSPKNGEQQPPPNKPEANPIKREELRYGGKDFNQWRRELLTELKGAIRVDGMKAFAAFGANGYAAEATDAILDIMRGYDTTNTNEKDDDGAVVAAGYTAIAKIGADTIPALTKGVKDRNRNVRRFAVRALGNQGSDARSAIADLLHAMKSEDSILQSQAIDAVYSIDLHAKGYVTALIEVLKGNKTGNRGQTARVLSGLGEEARPAIPALIAALGDEWEDVRLASMQALRTLGAGKEAVVAVSRLLLDKNQNVRTEAYRFLDSLGGDAEKAVPALIAVLKAPHGGNPAWAIDTLKSIGPQAKEAVPVLNEVLRGDDTQLRQKAFGALRKINPDGKR